MLASRVSDSKRKSLCCVVLCYSTLFPLISQLHRSLANSCTGTTSLPRKSSPPRPGPRDPQTPGVNSTTGPLGVLVPLEVLHGVAPTVRSRFLNTSATGDDRQPRLARITAVSSFRDPTQPTIPWPSPSLHALPGPWVHMLHRGSISS